MESSDSHSFWYSFCVLCFFLLMPTLGQTSTHTLDLEKRVDKVIAFAEEDVKERLELLDQSWLDHRLDKSVRNIIAFHLRNPRQTALNVGRAIAYFPIFEEELAAAGLPASLKYLPVIESALKPRALSWVGAQGLWQFMPLTAPEYGLTIDKYVDERMDAHKATRAAIRYLKSAYDYLDDWSLAIASYNAGKGCVKKAKRRSGRKNFWGVRNYLPRETRNYVPAFIAAIYLCEFYAAHDIEPKMPDMDRQLLERIIVKTPLSFYRIAQITGLSIDIIQDLNPAYKLGYLPAYKNGHNLILPQRVIPALRSYLSQQTKTCTNEPPLPWAETLEMPTYTPDNNNYSLFEETITASDSTLNEIAERIHMPTSQLAIWNQLSLIDSLQQGQIVHYYRPNTYRYLPERNLRTTNEYLATITLPQSLSPQNSMCLSSSHARMSLCVVLNKRQKPSSIIEDYPHIDIHQFMADNQIERNRFLPAGKIVFIDIAPN